MMQKLIFFLWILPLLQMPLCHSTGLDIFEKESIEANSFSSTEGLLSSIISNHVSAISGEFIDNETDCCLAGPEPLFLQRSYTSHPSMGLFGFEPTSLNPQSTFKIGYKHCGWQFNHLTRLHFQIDFSGHVKHAEISAFVPHAFFSQMLHRNKIKVPEGEYKREDCSLSLLLQKGVTNCCLGAISGRTNPKNVIAKVSDKHRKCDVIFGSGDVRHYEGYLKDDIGVVAIWKFSPKYEKKANGNQILYNKQAITVCNASGSTIFSHLKFNGTPHDIHIETSDNQTIHYQYASFKVKKTVPHDHRKHYYLTSVTRSNQPDESYEYTPNTIHTAWLLSKKSRPDQRFLEIEYYGLGDNPGKIHKVPIDCIWDPRNNRVKCLKAPVGTDSTPIQTHQFFYDFSFTIKKNKNVIIYGGRTTVYDVYQRKSVYIYNNYHRLKKSIQYANNKPYIQTKYLWEELELEKNTLLPINISTNLGNLMGKVMMDGHNNILTGRFFTYDKKGNILKEKFYGNLTGTSQIPILLSDNQAKKNGAEFYKKTFTYSDDELNLLLEENEANGRTTQYAYYSKTDLIYSKFLLNHDQICAREFYDYDENNALTRVICDNGTQKDKNNLSDISERRITYYYPRKIAPVGLPERIDEMVLDLATGQELLLKRKLQTFSIEGKMTKQEVFDASGNYCYTLEWQYDPHGNLIWERNALGEEIHKKYDANDNLIFEQGPSFETSTTYTYDFSNRCICEEKTHINGERFVTHYRYNLAGNRISQIDRYGHETLYQYDELNRIIATIYPKTAEETAPTRTKISYDCLGHRIEEVDGRGLVTQKTYNSRGAVTSILHPDGQLERFEYFLDGKLAKKIASNGSETRFEIDCFGRILSEKGYSQNGEFLYETHETYDKLHKVSTTDATGLITTHSYDIAGRLVQTICQDKVIHYEYDLLGRISKKKEPFDENQIKVTCTEYDFLDRVIEERIENENGTLLQKVSYQFDPLGNRTHVIEETKAGKSQHITLYNSDRQPIKTIDPEGKETHFYYNHSFRNGAGQLVLQTTVTDFFGRQTQITYDVKGRPIMTKKIDPFGLLLAFQEMRYDAEGLVTHILDHQIAQGKELRTIETMFTYHESGQLSSLTQAYKLPEQQITYMKYNNSGEKEVVVKPDGTSLHYSYDPLGRLQSYSSSDQTISYQFSYNKQHHVTHVEDLIQKNSSHFDYDTRGRLLNERLANGITIGYGSILR